LALVCQQCHALAHPGRRAACNLEIQRDGDDRGARQLAQPGTIVNHLGREPGQIKGLRPVRHRANACTPHPLPVPVTAFRSLDRA
jgi:hypothetical protein